MLIFIVIIIIYLNCCFIPVADAWKAGLTVTKLGPRPDCTRSACLH